MLAAIRDPDPVIFLEPTRLYRAVKQEVADDGRSAPLDVCYVLREGADVTLVTWGAMVKRCEEAAKASGRSVEVIDLRTLMPWDKEAVLASVKKTSRCLIVHEDLRSAGFGVASPSGNFSLPRNPPMVCGSASE